MKVTFEFEKKLFRTIRRKIGLYLCSKGFHDPRGNKWLCIWNTERCYWCNEEVKVKGFRQIS